jgi:hypothetical protein
MKLPFRSFSFLLSCALHLSFAKADDHGTVVETDDFKAVVEDGWLTGWTNKRSGETFEFGKPSGEVSAIYRPGSWVIPGYGEEKKAATWKLAASSPKAGELLLQQRLDVKDGFAQTVQWSVRLPLDKIDASYWPTGLTNRMIAQNSLPPEGAIGKSYYFSNRNAIISSHQWRQRYFVIQGKKGGLVIQMDDPKLDHFGVVEMDPANFPKEVVLTQRSIAAPPWTSEYSGGKWTITQYDGWVNQGAKIRQDYIVDAFELKPLSSRPTAWVQDLVWAYVRAPFTSPPTNFPGSNNPDYTENWEKNLKLVDDWLDNLSKVLEPKKVMFYVNWWRYAAHDTMFPEHSVDPFFAMAVGKARKRGYHVMLHFHNHLAQDGASAFFGRYITKQDEWHKEAFPNRAKAIGDPEGKIPWGVGYDFVRRTDVIQRDKEFGTTSSARLGLPVRMTGYHMSPAYEGWRYMKVAEILSAVRATGADAIHIDVPAVWPEGKERFGINSQQGSREFFKLLRETLDENGLDYVAIATEGSPGEGYIRYVDMAQLVRGASTVNMLDGISVDTMIELQLGDDLEKAKAMREAAKARYPTDKERALKSALRFDEKSAAIGLAKVRELGEPNLDAMVISPYVRAYPHLGSGNPLMGGYKDDPAAAIHNQAAQAMHTWASVQRDSPFSSSPSIQMFFDAPPWDALDEIKTARKEAIKSGKRTEGKVFNQFSFGEFALARWWEKYEPRFAPLGEWKRGDVARYRTSDGRTLAARKTDPLTLSFTVDDKPLVEFGIFGGWKNSDALFKEFGPEFLRNQIDSVDKKP